MAEVLEVEPGGDLAFPGHALAKDVPHFRDAADATAAEHLDEDLLTQRAQGHVGEGTPTHHEASAHRIGNPSHDGGEHAEAEELRAL